MAFDREKLVTNWIWTSDWQIGDDHEARVVYFRKEAELTGTLPASKKIRITADSRYKLYVNGLFVTEGPQKALDTKEWYVDTAELAPYLMPGRNTVAVEVLRFPELTLTGMCFNANGSLYRTEIPNLYVEDMGVEDGEEAFTDSMILKGKSGWKCYTDRARRIFGDGDGACIQPQEDTVSTAELSGWKKNGYDDAWWKMAVPKTKFDLLFSDAPGTLVPRTIPQQRHTEKCFAGVLKIRSVDDGAEKKCLRENYEQMLGGTGIVEIPPYTEQAVEISAGTEQCGYLLYEFAGGAGAKITTLCSECYISMETDKNGNRKPVKGIRDDSANGTLKGQESSYVVAGCGTEENPEEYEPYWFRTFRYIRLLIKTGGQSLRFLKFYYRTTGYPLDVKTSFQISDQEYQAVWDISVRTLKRCMHETYMDCPFYEQYQYAMDTRSEILYTYSISADDRLARQAMEAFRRSQRPDGMIAANAPSVKAGVIPGFSIYYILMVYDHMMYFGDRTLVEWNFPAIERVLAFFENHLNENGLVGKVGGRLFAERYWSFIDWSPAWQDYSGMPKASERGTGAITMESLLYLYGLLKTSELAEYIGRRELAKKYGENAKELKKAIADFCMENYQDGKEKNFLVQDGPGVKLYSVHCQVFAVLTGLMDEIQGREALEHTIGNDAFAQPSVAFMYYVFRALEQCGIYGETDCLWDVWRDMLRDHLSTCVENNTDKRSDCHAWGSLMCYEIPSAILGVTPAAPGYRKVKIAPQFCKMNQASGDVITPQGYVHVTWEKKEDGTCKVEYQIPEGMELAEEER